YDFHEHQFCEPSQHRFAAGTPDVGFLGSKAQHVRQPALSGRRHLGVKHARQGFEQGIERPRVAAEEAAYDMSSLPATAIEMCYDGKLAVAGTGVKFKVGFTAHARRRTQNVRVAHREDDDVASIEVHAWLIAIDERCPARSPHQGMEIDHMLDLR